MSSESDSIIERIDRLPLTSVHKRILASVGAATFFDAFDALAIAFVLPVLAGLWRLTPQQIGIAISAGYLGQMIGAVLIGFLAESIGRRPALALAIGVMSVLSVACAFAASFQALVFWRLLQGVGLGGEVPLGATYINELTPARLRGRVVFLFEGMFAIGVAITALAATWTIPHWGWRSMFVIGGAPLLLLPLVLRLPESPRWLAHKGRYIEADAAFERIEAAGARNGRQVSAPVEQVGTVLSASILSLFRNGYAARTLTLWLLLFCTSAVGYGLFTWLPSLYRTVFHLPLDKILLYGFINSAMTPIGALAGALFIDRLGRRICFASSFIGTAVPMLLLWRLAEGVTAGQVLFLSSIACFSISILMAGIYVYGPEIYPTRIRALGTGVGTSFFRLAAILSPIAVGFILPAFGVSAVFLAFACTAIVGTFVVILFVIEMRGRAMEETLA